MCRHRAAGNGSVSLQCFTNPCMLVTAGASSGRETRSSELHQREALYITHHIGLRRASGQCGDLYSIKYGETVWKAGTRSASERKAWKECPPRGARFTAVRAKGRDERQSVIGVVDERRELFPIEVMITCRQTRFYPLANSSNVY